MINYIFITSNLSDLSGTYKSQTSGCMHFSLSLTPFETDPNWHYNRTQNCTSRCKYSAITCYHKSFPLITRTLREYCLLTIISLAISSLHYQVVGMKYGVNIVLTTPGPPSEVKRSVSSLLTAFYQYEEDLQRRFH